jgi:hypothetical protein
MNCREPLGEGAWRFVLRKLAQELERRTGVPVVIFAVLQVNRLRPRYHCHALIAPASPAPALVESDREHLLALERWKGSESLGPWLTRLLSQVQPVYRPYVQPDNAGSVSLRPVTPRGNSQDPRSLVNYVARYLLREDMGAWLEIGDLRKVVGAR